MELHLFISKINIRMACDNKDISLEERKELCWAFKTPNILADHRGANFKGELQN
jgi:hypothetical protein